MAESTYWRGKRVLVTGGAGFIGSNVVDQLIALGAEVRITSYGGLSAEEERNLSGIRNQVEVVPADLTKLDEAKAACANQDVVMNLAAHVGGIGYNKTHPATSFRDNIWISTVVLEAARLATVKRFLAVSTVAVYANKAPVPTPESFGFEGEPDPAKNGYGWAKRMAEFAGQAYATEFGMEVAIVRPSNAYGPRDRFDQNSGHVIPSLIIRLANNEDPLIVWGSGNQSRTFIYVDDFARGLIQATENYAVADPINICSSEETTIKALAEMILEEMGSTSKIEFDTTKPDGQPRSAPSAAKAKEKAGFEAKVMLRDGIKQTIAWYREHRAELEAVDQKK